MSNNQNAPKKPGQILVVTPDTKSDNPTPAPEASTLKTTPEVTPPDPIEQAKAANARKLVELGQKFMRLEELTQLRKNLQILTETRENLRQFKFEQTGDVSNVAVLIIKDSTGREFSTRRTALIEEQIDFFETKLNEKMAKITDQALSFNLG